MLDLDHAAGALATWLGENIAGVNDVVIGHVARPKAAGSSAETLLFDAEWTRDGARETVGLVLRRQFAGHAIVHQAGLDLEVKVMRLLSELGDPAIRVPTVYGEEKGSDLLGTPFVVVEQVAGRIAPQFPNYNQHGWLHDMDEDARRHTWCSAMEAIAAIHRVKATQDFGFLARGKAPTLSGLIDWIEDWYRASINGRDYPLGEAALAYLRTNLPADVAMGVLWGDAIPANMLFDERGDVKAVIDWELAMLGPGEIDLAWWLMFDEMLSDAAGITRLPGLPDRAQTIAIYERARGRPTRDMDYYTALSLFRMCIVTMRAVDRQVAIAGFHPANQAWSNHPTAGMLARRLGHGRLDVSPDFVAFLKSLKAMRR